MSGLLRWGFIGAGKIAHEFVSALRTLPTDHHQLIAIGSRSLEQAKKFAEDHDIPKFYGNYFQLVQDPGIDIIYVGTVNSCHYQQSKMALEAGKHVLCEKPLCLTADQAKDLVRISRENKLFLMEGHWTRFFPAYKAFLDDIRQGKIGHVYQIILGIGNVVSNLDRFRLRELGGGILMNHGVYGIALATHILGKPKRIAASGFLSPEGVDVTNTFTLIYEHGEQASIICNSFVKMPAEVIVVGTKGTLKLPWPFWAPTAVESSLEGTRTFALPQVKSSASGVNTTGFVYEVEEVRRCIKQGLLSSPYMPPEESVMIYEICDEIRRQLKVEFEADEVDVPL